MACLYTFMNDELGEVLVKCFPDRWIDVIIFKKGSVIAIFSQSSHMDAVATGTQLPNLQTQIFFFILSEKPEKPHCHFVRQHCISSSSSTALKCRILPLVVHFKLKIPALSVFTPYFCVELHLQQPSSGNSMFLLNAKFNWIRVFKLDY